MERHRYHLDLIVRGADRYNLPDILVDEYLPLTAQVPIWQVCEELRKGHFHYEHECAEPIEEFELNLEALSAYLHQIVQGFHAVEAIEADRARLLQARKIIGRQGEVLSVPLLLPRSLLLDDLDPDADDLEHIASRWPEYPRWFQDGMRRKYPELRGL
ncbi:MAG: hypothetical protein O2807_07080 [bacterium]|nr:hypothetical protein [bacterium]